MKRDDTLRVVHGLRLLLPPTWEDSSIYRFNAPPNESEKLQPNVMVSRHVKNPGDSPERFLELTNLDAKKADATYEVLREGTVIYLDQVSAWQDAKFTDARTGELVHQRRVVAATWPNHFTLLTLTGTPRALDAMSLELGLEHLGEVPAGVREGGVMAALVSKPD
ncbi:MAG: DcrB-related protein [Myxococcaceae bacterium]|nr:DcrB-related protein [Myxococcaceae bacterium]